MKYKKCPLCGFKCTNLKLARCPKEFGCGKGNLPPVIYDDEVNNAPPPEPDSPTNELIRVCDNCGTKNKPNARKCSNPDCEEDIFYITPTPDIEPSSSPAGYALVSVDGKAAFDIANPLHIIGRENELSEYLKPKTFVSRTHAKITLHDNLIYLTDLNAANGTYVNNDKIENDVPTLLNDGDEIGLGGNTNGGNYHERAAYFKVKALAR